MPRNVFALMTTPVRGSRVVLFLLVAAVTTLGLPARGVILWSDLGTTHIHENGAGSDIIGGAIRRDQTASDALYFKFRIDPLSDSKTEEYFAAFELFEGKEERLAIGNSRLAWGYSAFNAEESGEFNKAFGDVDLHSARPEPNGATNFFPYEVVQRGVECTIVFKVQYVSGEPASVTAWLNPELGAGATEESQPGNLTTQFRARATFDEIHLRHGGGGGGWNFSDMAIGTSFSDFVAGAGMMPGIARDASAFNFRSWQVEQGLPQNSVHCIAQTREGYIWVGSDDGIARFDGVRFVSFGLREGLRTGPVQTLFADSKGTLWIGSAGGGLTRWRDGQFTTFTMRDQLPADSITALAEDGEGLLWIGTEGGLAIWLGDKPTLTAVTDEFKGKQVTTLFKDKQGAMWTGVKGAGVFQFAGGKFVSLADGTAEGLLQDPHCLLVDRENKIWIGAGDDFVLCRDGDQLHRYRIPRHLAKPYITALTEEPDGTVWAGSVSEGLFQFREGKLAAVNASSGLSDNVVESLLMDREGKLWVGTDSGLNQLRRKNLSAFSNEQGLGYGAVQGLTEISGGTILAGKPSDGLYGWEGKGFNRLAAGDSSQADPQINALLTVRDGSCWVAAGHGLLHFKNPQSMSNETGVVALAGLNVISLSEDNGGGIWAGTRNGELWHLQSGAWVARSNLWQPHAITTMAQGAAGMWVGTEGGGLFELQSDTIRTRLGKGSGLLSDLIRTLYMDGQGTLWIGTAGGGLTRWNNGAIATFTTREGLPDDTVSQILEDDAGRLWLGGNRGICCVGKHELGELMARNIPGVYPQIYGRADGMLSEECTGGFCPAGLKSKSGLLWFSTLKGVVVADPRPGNSGEPPPAVFLEEVLIDGITKHELRMNSRLGEKGGLPGSGRDGLIIPPGKHRLEFRYTGLSFGAPERVRFRYRLEPLDSDWVDAAERGTRRTASYSYVPPGDYRFRVIACNADGVWNDTGAGMELTVSSHFWQAWWFIGLAGLALIGAVGGAARFVEKEKLQRRLKRLEQERALERERARIAQDLHDDLGSSLTRISLLSDLARADKHHPGQIEAHAKKISQSAAQTVRALEEIVWALRPGSDSLQSLIEYIAHVANETFEGDRARCRLDLPHNVPVRPLPPEMRHNIFLIVKEALTNALKHASAKEVRVQAKATEYSLAITVQDDGKGFDTAAVPGRTGRQGLGNMRRRAEAMNGRLEIRSAGGEGTTVALTVNFPAGRISGAT